MPADKSLQVRRRRALLHEMANLEVGIPSSATHRGPAARADDDVANDGADDDGADLVEDELADARPVAASRRTPHERGRAGPGNTKEKARPKFPIPWAVGLSFLRAPSIETFYGIPVAGVCTRQKGRAEGSDCSAEDGHRLRVPP